MKRTMTAMMVVALALAMGAGGCATVKKKFTRKKGETEVRPVVYVEKDYAKPYTNEYYYSSNFSMWKVWHEELINSIGGNDKRRDRAADEAVARLKEMQNYLEEPKRAELGDQIAQMERAISNIRNGVSDSSGGQAKFVLDKTLRIVKADFESDDMKAWIKKDEIVL